MLITCLHISITSDIHHLKTGVETAIEYLQNGIPHITEEDLFDMRLVYSELITNAMIHGNKNDTGKKIELSIIINSETITSVIKDEGGGFNYSNFINPTGKVYDLFNEHGRGIRLVLSLTDLVKWNETGNEVMFSKNFKTH